MPSSLYEGLTNRKSIFPDKSSADYKRAKSVNAMPTRESTPKVNMPAGPRDA
jgi:hypothetical protein